MKTPFLKSLKGKFVLRTVLIALAVATVIGGLAINSMRSLSSTATNAVNDAAAAGDAEAAAALEALADDVSSASSSLLLLVVIGAVVTALAAGAMGLMFGRKVTQPIVALRSATKTSTGVLPEIATAATEGLEMPTLPTIALSTGDELQDLADSIDYMQRIAADHIAAPAMAEPEPTDDVATEQLMRLGDRSHALLGQQMSFIEEMEKDEANPANLQRLFQVDHLATRMRRNAESFLILADEDSPRTLSRSVSMHQVVQAASSEIEHFERISISDISSVSVDGAVATDLAHLVAELLENATKFSPDNVKTSVGGRSTDHGYLIDIIDYGQGMSPEAIESANARLSGGAASDDDEAPTIGYDIVTRLAKRHGVALRLSATPTGGLTVQVHVPESALAEPSKAKAQPAYSEPEPVVESAPVAADPVTVASADIDSSALESLAIEADPLASVTTEPAMSDFDIPAEAEIAAAPEARYGEHGLTSEQQAAIDWAIEEGWGDVHADMATDADTVPTVLDSSAEAAPLLAAAMANTELQAGPIDASELAELEATMASSAQPGTATEHDSAL